IYQKIRLVNFLRLGKELGSDDQWKTDDQLLRPVLPDDALLCVLEDDDDDKDCDSDRQGKSSGWDDGDASWQEKYTQLLQEFAQYKASVRDSFAKANDLSASELMAPTAAVAGEKDDGGEPPMDYYFSSYADTEIHEIMLKDQVRTQAYRDAVYDSKHLFEGKTVLDVGCGTGILSMFCARAGAARVYAVDNSSIILKAREIAAENGLGPDRITFLRGRIEDLLKTEPLAGVHVDYIISEWMGYFLLFEGMLDSVIRARDVLAAANPGVKMLPASSRIHVAALSHEEMMNDSYHYWNNVYGFSMTPMKPGFIRTARVTYIDARRHAEEGDPVVVSDSACVKCIDMDKDTVASLDFAAPFTLTMEASGRVHGLIAWFDVEFAPGGVSFTTSPHAEYTHWKQTCFILEDGGVEACAGDQICGTLRCEKSADNERELVVTITYSVKPAATGSPDGPETRTQTWLVA
ncbi:MAG: hypothetical protein SGCHY_002857, partial [Lobulomycetales sp.]